MNFVIYGIDRIGKNTFIDNVLPQYKQIQLTKPPEGSDALQFSKNQYFDYFMSLKYDDKIVYNRGHIDEFVYAPRYRKYSIDWLRSMEQEFSSYLDNTISILLYTTNFDFLIDDGLSLDYNQRDKEQEDFFKEFDNSKLKNKILLKVNDKGKYKKQEDIKDEFINSLINLFSTRSSTI